MTILTTLGFPLITIIFYGLFIQELKSGIVATSWQKEKKRKVRNRIIIGLVVWAIIISAVSLSGFSGEFELFPLNIMPFVIVPLITTLILLFHKDTNALLSKINLKVLTRLQAFRVFVEIVLWLLFIQNLLPEQMTIEGRNFDIIAGITSLLAARFILNSRRLMIVWNIIGLALLINIVSIAILSMPTSLRIFENEPANIIITQFPFIVLPTFLVPLAYILHFLSLKKLLMKS
ncbi:hypothetical protein MEO93_26630 [Dolichospermum sp. ST_sed3]|nr:hypothetical protein [Dolichospermum sp. ST_sed3]